MHESPVPVSALAQKAAVPGICEVSALCHVNLRGNAADATFRAAVHAATGCELPPRANTVTTSGDTRLVWLGPDEWLIIAPEAAEQTLCTTLATSLVAVHHAVTCVSHGQTLIRITSPAAGDLLAAGCPLDLHPRVFAAPQCAQSHYMKAPVLIIAAADGQGFDLIVRRAFAEYLWEALVESDSR